MAFSLIIIGAVLLIAGIRNTVDGDGGLFTLLQGDFTGPNNFIFWLAAVLIIGAIGYIPKLQPISTGMLVLILIVLFLSKGSTDFFQKLVSGLGSTSSAGGGGGGLLNTSSPINLGGNGGTISI
jgi:hypothetical protein